MSAIPTAIELHNEEPVVLVARERSLDAATRFYRPELDLLRFLAFLAVFFHHSLPGFELTKHIGLALRLGEAETIMKAAGGFGVCLFFLLSAYLITEILQREIQTSGDLNIRSFYKRRILRIWPLYFCFATAAVVIGFLNTTLRVEPCRILAFALLCGNWYVSRMGCGDSPIAPLWSISVEEQFYLVWPWIARLGRRFTLVACLLILPISWITIYVVTRIESNPGRALWVNSFVQFQFFALGSALAVFLNGRAPRFEKRIRAVALFTGLGLWLVAAGVCHLKEDGWAVGWVYGVAGYVVVGAGCILILIFLAFLGAPVSKSSRLVYLGKISYGLYVFHLAAVQLSWKLLPSFVKATGATIGFTRFASPVAVQVFALAITIGLATISYHALETPFLRLKERFTLVRSRAV